MTLSELKREFDADIVGPLIYEHVELLVRGASHRYKPKVYAERPAPSGRWAPELIEDLMQSFFTDVLIGQSQLRYAFDHAHDLESLDSIVRAQLRRHLRNRRRRSVVDNLVERARHMLAEEGIGAVTGAEPRGASLREAGTNEDAVRAAACLVAQIPRIPIHRAEPAYGSERAQRLHGRESETGARGHRQYDETAGNAGRDQSCAHARVDRSHRNRPSSI